MCMSLCQCFGQLFFLNQVVWVTINVNVPCQLLFLSQVWATINVNVPGQVSFLSQVPGAKYELLSMSMFLVSCLSWAKHEPLSMSMLLVSCFSWTKDEPLSMSMFLVSCLFWARYEPLSMSMFLVSCLSFAKYEPLSMSMLFVSCLSWAKERATVNIYVPGQLSFLSQGHNRWSSTLIHPWWLGSPSHSANINKRFNCAKVVYPILVKLDNYKYFDICCVAEQNIPPKHHFWSVPSLRYKVYNVMF